MKDDAIINDYVKRLGDARELFKVIAACGGSATLQAHRHIDVIDKNLSIISRVNDAVSATEKMMRARGVTP
ncbi:MAG: hypothetical protein AAFQ81_09285 [Pseudomonadota bacterium]